MAHPLCRSLDYSEDLDRIVIGTNHCDVKEIAGDTVVRGLRDAACMSGRLLHHV